MGANLAALRSDDPHTGSSCDLRGSGRVRWPSWRRKVSTTRRRCRSGSRGPTLPHPNWSAALQFHWRIRHVDSGGVAPALRRLAPGSDRGSAGHPRPRLPPDPHHRVRLVAGPSPSGSRHRQGDASGGLAPRFRRFGSQTCRDGRVNTTMRHSVSPGRSATSPTATRSSRSRPRPSWPSR